MNLAEGNSRRSKKDKAHFFEIALGSLEELHYQSLLARDLEYMSLAEFTEAEDKIARTSYLVAKLRASCLQGSSTSSIPSISSVSSSHVLH